MRAWVLQQQQQEARRKQLNDLAKQTQQSE